MQFDDTSEDEIMYSQSSLDIYMFKIQHQKVKWGVVLGMSSHY